MKVEIEISEEQVKKALDAQVSAAISQMTGRYGAQDDVTSAVKKYWNSLVDERVRARLVDSEQMTRMIDEAVAAQVKAKLNKLLKATA